MKHSDTFRIIFQVQGDLSDREGLNAGKREFLDLPSITISPYDGMDDSIEVAGELNRETRGLFLTFVAPSFQGWKSHLWSFQFLKGGEAMLRVEDFTVALLFLEESERENLLALGVDGNGLEEIDNLSA
jgi:hypothetical protein